MTSDKERKYKVVLTSASHAMHRQEVGIKEFPFLLLSGSHYWRQLFFFCFNTNTETSTFDCCRYKEVLRLAAERLNTEAPEEKGTKQGALRQPGQPLGVVKRECVMHSMQLWCQVARSKRCPSILRLSSQCFLAPTHSVHFSSSISCLTSAT